jgi:hypothetical protein
MFRIFILIFLTIIAGVAFTNPQLISEFLLSKPKEVVLIPAIKPETILDDKLVEPKNITRSEVYKWVDENGQLHYSDKSSGESEQPSEKITVTTETTEFTKTPYIKRVNTSNSVQTSSQDSLSSRCQRLKNRATRDAERLRRAGRSPTRDRKLRKTRWEIIKNC